MARTSDRPLRVVTYARASTRDQKVRGNSIQDQRARFDAWIKRMGFELVDSFTEIVSGSKNQTTEYFEAMMQSLPQLQVDALAVVALDRWSRDMLEAPASIKALRSANIKVFELTHSETEPFDLKKDTDRDYLMDRFKGAEHELRSITRRNRARAAAERERGAVTHNKAPFGLKIVNSHSSGDRGLAIDPDTIEYVREAEEAVLRGDSLPSIVERFQDVPGFWTTAPGLRNAMLDAAGGYVRAGARTPERQAQINAQWITRRATSSARKQYEHELSGLVGCKLCHDAGEASIGMYGWLARGNPNLCCIGVKGKRKIHHPVYVQAAKVLPMLIERLQVIARDRTVAQRVLDLMEGARSTPDTNEKQRRHLERSLRGFDEEEARLEKRLAFAFDLAAEGGAGSAEGRRMIESAETERFAIDARRAATRSKLAGLPLVRTEAMDVRELMYTVGQWPDFRMGDGGLVEATIREPLARWVKAVGMPLVERDRRRHHEFVLTWAFVDEVVNEARKLAAPRRKARTSSK